MIGSPIIKYWVIKVTEQQIFHAATNAISFYTAAKRCNLKGMIPIGTPSIINGSFSVELALKAILYSDGVDCKGHHLLALMKKLPSEICIEIQNYLAEDWPDYEQQLKNCDKAFVDWRYVHEIDKELNINTNFLILLSEICCRIMMEKIGMTSNVELQDMI